MLEIGYFDLGNGDCGPSMRSVVATLDFERQLATAGEEKGSTRFNQRGKSSTKFRHMEKGSISIQKGSKGSKKEKGKWFEPTTCYHSFSGRFHKVPNRFYISNMWKGKRSDTTDFFRSYARKLVPPETRRRKDTPLQQVTAIFLNFLPGLKRQNSSLKLPFTGHP